VALAAAFDGRRGIHAVTRQNSEQNWIAYVGLQLLLGPEGVVDGGARAASED